MDELRKLLQDDLPRLGTYFLDMTTVQGDGVLLVHYYPDDKVAQMEAKFLKASVIRKWARQMGLADLETQFEQHDRQTQMVVAVITPETKGTVTIEVSSTSPQPPEPETAAPANKSATTKPKARGKTSTRTTKTSTRTTKTSPEPQPEASTPPAKSATKSKARGKTSTRTTDPSPEPEPQPEASAPPAKPAKPATRHKARRNPTRTTARRRKAT